MEMHSAWRNAILALAIAVPALSAAQAPDSSAKILTSERADREQFLAEGAKKEGVKVKGWRAGSEKVQQRALTEARAHRNDADVIETNGPELESLYREKILQPFKSPHLKNLAREALRPTGPGGGPRINMFVQMYNPKLVGKEDLTKKFADLADARWKGKLGIEAQDEDWFATVVKGEGEEQGLRLFRQIGKSNGFSVRKGHTLIASLVASGEIAFALTTYSHGAENMKQKGAPGDWYGIEPAIGRANGIAIPRAVAHPYSAMLFTDFVLSPEGQKILEKGGYVPANLKVASPAQKIRLKFVDPATVLDEEAKWQKLYAEIVIGNAR